MPLSVADRAALYGTRRKEHPEQDLQINLVKHIRWRLMPRVVFFAVPNGEKRSKVTGAILKAMGVRAGVHDLIFLLPGPVLFTLELKAGNNGMSPEQEAFARDIEAIGGSWAVASTLDDALRILVAVGVIKPDAA